MQFKINRQKIDEFKCKTNYRKNQIAGGTYSGMWTKWKKGQRSPNISNLEKIGQECDLNAAELAIAILELREEYRQQQSVVQEKQVNQVKSEVEGVCDRIIGILNNGTQPLSVIISQLNISQTVVVSAISRLHNNQVIQAKAKDKDIFYSLKEG